jgi:hypothetical protein
MPGLSAPNVNYVKEYPVRAGILPTSTIWSSDDTSTSTSNPCAERGSYLSGIFAVIEVPIPIGLATCS